MSLDVSLNMKSCRCCERPAETVYSANITHNVNAIATHVDLYYPIWRPEEINITKAKELIPPLIKGLESLKRNPKICKTLNPSNGWGNYDGFVEFVENYLEACKQYPNADIEISR